MSLIEAVQQGNAAKALELLIQGADPNETDKYYGWTSLHITARDGKVALAKLLIKHGANVDFLDSIKQTPLHRAAFWGQLSMIKLLIENSADFTALDNVFQTPEELATQQNHLRCAEYIKRCYALLKLGALVKYPPEKIDKMNTQMEDKAKEEKRRKELKIELDKVGEKSTKIKEKYLAKEAKLIEKRDVLMAKIDTLREEMEKLSKLTGTELSRKDITRLKHLQGKLTKIQMELDEQKAKIVKTRRKSLQEVEVEQRGAAWIDFINS